MGNPKQKWTPEEEDALRKGVVKHGTGKWKNIQNDPEFNQYLYSRSNIDLKDKWRNMSVSANCQGPREKSRTPKIKANPDALVASPVPLNVHAPASSSLVVYEQPTDVVMDDSLKYVLDGKTASKYNSMIYEALSTLKDPNGSDTSTIAGIIEERYELPSNFRRLLSARLRRLVRQDKLEKIENRYRIKTDILSPETSNSVPKAKEGRFEQPQASRVHHLGDTLEEAAIEAARMIAEAENKAAIAAEAVREAERVARMAEETDALLQLAKEIYETCSSGGTVMLA